MSERACLVCGCTESKACRPTKEIPYACSWIRKDVDVCDRCVWDSMSVDALCKSIAAAAARAGAIANAETSAIDYQLYGHEQELLRERVRRLEARIPHVVRVRRPTPEQLAEVKTHVDPWILERLVQVLEYLPQPIGDADRDKANNDDCWTKILAEGLRRCAGDFKVELEKAQLRALAGVKPARRPSAAAAAARAYRSASSRSKRAPAAPGPRADPRRARAGSSRRSASDNAA
jgi:hypothetical protein